MVENEVFVHAEQSPTPYMLKSVMPRKGENFPKNYELVGKFQEMPHIYIVQITCNHAIRLILFCNFVNWLFRYFFRPRT